MRLFFIHKSRAQKGFQREKEIPNLDFYSKRAINLKRHQKILSFAFGLHTIEYSVKIGFLIGILFWSFSLILNPYSIALFPKIEFPEANASALEKIEEKRLVYSLTLTKENILSAFGENYPVASNERIEIFSNYMLSEPRVIVFLNIDKETRMEYVYQLTEDLKKAGMYKIYFGAKLSKE